MTSTAPTVPATKSKWASKTLWANALALVALIAQTALGTDIFPIEYQAMALTGINAVLRLFTKQELS